VVEKSRWLRLLFSREFEMEDLLVLWDAIFAADPNLTMVEWIAVAMLLILRKDCKYFFYSETKN
jgi:TBC1 domain family protein 5